MKNKLRKFVQKLYLAKFKKRNSLDFINDLKKYNEIKDFKINSNIYESGQSIDKYTHFIMRSITQYYLTKTFKAMKIDMNDVNVHVDLDSGNIGTPGRVAKMWVGHDNEDNSELLSGRWSTNPRMASFKDMEEDEELKKVSKKIPITKRIDIISNCSHHIVPFSTLFRPDSYAMISYIPENGYDIGISKLQKIADHISKRGWLQEDLTKAIYKEVSKVSETKSVYVRLYNVVHNCEFLRGAKSRDGALTTEFYGGKFKKNKLRQQILTK